MSEKTSTMIDEKQKYINNMLVRYRKASNKEMRDH